ncbi:hypothetical protein CC79DRAFT_1337274 [Sarocladium strictum]
MDHAVSLFNDVVHAPAKALAGASLAEWEVAGKLKVMVESQRKYSAAEKLHAFKTEIAPYFDTLEGRAPKHIYMAASHYLGQLVAEVSRRGILGLSIELSEQLARIGNWDMTSRNTLVLNLCHTLMLSKSPQTEAAVKQALAELIDVWKHMSQLGRASQVGQPLAFTLPNTEEIHRNVEGVLRNRKQEQINKPNAEPISPSQIQSVQALATLFLTSSTSNATRVVPSLLATVVVLWDRRIIGWHVPPEAEPLLKAVATVLHLTKVNVSDISKVFDPKFIRFPTNKAQRLVPYITGQWPRVVESLLKTEDKSWGDTILPIASRSGGSYLSSLHRKLRAARNSRNVPVIDELWRTFKAKLKTSPELLSQLREDVEFVDYWIFVFCSLRRNQQLQELVQLMNSVDMEPSLKSYTAMMHGWRAAKDTAKIDALWTFLSTSDMRLDSYIWAERISAYIEASKPQRAIEALGEMMRLWKTAVADGKPEDAAKPTIEVINAALKELLRLDKIAAKDVLAWASAEGIYPDLVTYNILLREAFRSDEADSVPILLATMREQGIELDSASFTVILEEVLGTMHNASADEQCRAVRKIFRDMAAAGTKPIQETYAKMLFAISRLHNGGSDEAVDAVLEHAKVNKVSITPHMVTILIERVLRGSEPDMDAIEKLLSRYQLKRIGDGDPTLWERVMTGYALCNDIPKAMEIFEVLQKSGTPPSTQSCLEDLLVALLQKGHQDMAQKVVSSTLSNQMKGHKEPRGNERYWKHHFWFLAKSRGLLNDLELPPLLLETLGG